MLLMRVIYVGTEGKGHVLDAKEWGKDYSYSSCLFPLSSLFYHPCHLLFRFSPYCYCLASLAGIRVFKLALLLLPALGML